MDEEENELFQKTDVAIFPDTRASQSGAAHIAISYGIPIIVSEVGGLKESMACYKGTIFVEPRDITQLTEKIIYSYTLKGCRYDNPHPCEKTVEAYNQIFTYLVEKHS